MIEIYNKIWQLLTTLEKKKATLLILLMIILAFVEILGVSSIVPFLSILGDPTLISTNKYLSFFYTYLNFTEVKAFMIFLGFIAIGVLFVNAGLKALTAYALYNFTNHRRHSIGFRLLKQYLHMPYSFFLNQNSSNISKIILSEVDQLVGTVIIPAFNLITHLIISITLTVFLVVINSTVAIVVCSSFGLFYLLVFFSIKKHITRIGVERTNANSARFKVVSETIGGIKDIKIRGKEKIYLSSFEQPSSSFAAYAASSRTLAVVPQYLVEIIAFGTILSMTILALNSQEINLGELLPTLGLFSFTILKLKPSINNIYSALSSLRYGRSILETICLEAQRTPEKSASIENDNKRLKLSNSIDCKDLSFSYDKNSHKILNSINLKIKANTTVGIIGATGAGKSTLLDIILGLLSPTLGSIYIDDKKLSTDNIRQWQNSIGYVSQNIFLTDNSIAQNIAFGQPEEKIDSIKIKEVAKTAQIHDFIESLPEQYNTTIGERGVRLSGGQRQRLGIARALYHSPELLVLDEATSALDNVTEKDVMRAIDAMRGERTIIIIAHRLSTLDNCDRVIKLQNGNILD